MSRQCIARRGDHTLGHWAAQLQIAGGGERHQGREEQKALAEVSEEIARAIRTVIKREVREAEVAELIAENSRRIDALEAMLGGGPGAVSTRRSRGTA